ncbi:hypothetical protein A2V82_12635 [candidate division KSB1 bacterium RBG_16_48_16]|nr:MAG: hypothetical protein A2V82_12635 [candidate division KSB1 bacterium RBG_16_48_16]
MLIIFFNMYMYRFISIKTKKEKAVSIQIFNNCWRLRAFISILFSQMETPPLTRGVKPTMLSSALLTVNNSKN